MAFTFLVTTFIWSFYPGLDLLPKVTGCCPKVFSVFHNTEPTQRHFPQPSLHATLPSSLLRETLIPTTYHPCLLLLNLLEGRPWREATSMRAQSRNSSCHSAFKCCLYFCPMMGHFWKPPLIFCPSKNTFPFIAFVWVVWGQPEHPVSVSWKHFGVPVP